MPLSIAADRRTTSTARAETAAVEVSVCIANWNCAPLLRRCLASLLTYPQGVSFDVVVVDNASTDGAAAMVAAEFPRVKLVRNRENRGFAVASNQAAAAGGGRYLFFLNNDTEVPPQTLHSLVEHARANPGVGLIGPRLREPSGAVQISYRRRPTVAALLHRLSLFRWTGLFRDAYKDYRRGSFRAEGTRPVEVLMGPAIFIPRDVFAAVGGWDERYRFGLEDIDLSMHVGRSRPVLYVDDVEVIHHGRVSSRANVGFVAPSVATGYVQFFRKSGVGRWPLFWYKLAVTLDAPAQLIGKVIEAIARRATGQRRNAAQSWAAARGLWSFLRFELARFWRA
jgi:N-acetylglucosaminyl-diphospho-decaprenol L-rhamnosyltransferase